MTYILLICDDFFVLFQEGGQCYCKENVEGRQCDVCKAGYFNLTSEKPLGCQGCECNPLGSLAGDVTCFFETGQCNCKKNVRGKN